MEASKCKLSNIPALRCDHSPAKRHSQTNQQDSSV